MATEHLQISDLAKFLDRRPNTIRGWERDGVLPKKLCSQRDENGWRYWTRTQAEGIQAWIVKNDRRPGKALKNYTPTPEQVAAHIAKTRRNSDELAD